MATILPVFNPIAGVPEAIRGFVERNRFNEQRRRQGQQFGQVFGPQYSGITNPNIQQFIANQALQASKPTSPQSQGQFVAFLGNKIANGTATARDNALFNQLTAKAGTTVNVNTGEGLTGNIREQAAALKEGQEILNDFKQDPANKKTLEKSDVNVVTNTKGQLQLEVKPKGAPAATQIKEISDLVGLLDSTNTIESTFNEGFVGLLEGQGGLRTISEKTGLNVIESIKQRRKVPISTEQVQFSRVVSDLSDRLLRARSGAQINEQEFKRLQKILPELSLSEGPFKARLASFKKELENIIATKKQVIREAGQRPLSLDRPTTSTRPVRQGVNSLAEKHGF